jgi:hypothetical protein
MARSVELRCLACAHAFGRERPARVSVASPFRDCPRCGAPVRRPAASEWTLLGPGERAYWFVDRIAPFVVLGLLPALLYWALVVRSGGGDPRLLAALLVLGPLVCAALPVAGARTAVRRSRARMSDPMYRARLLAFERQEADTAAQSDAPTESVS